MGICLPPPDLHHSSRGSVDANVGRVLHAGKERSLRSCRIKDVSGSASCGRFGITEVAWLMAHRPSISGCVYPVDIRSDKTHPFDYIRRRVEFD